jgi:tetratricopeptide (TPR) repeat protein
MTQILKNNLEKALLAHQKGHLLEAELLYREFIKIAPNDSNGWYLLGTLCYQTKNINEAKEYLNHSIKLTPDFPQALNSRGILYKENDEMSAAEHDFRAAISLEPAFPEALTNLADTCRLIGNYGEASYLNNQAIKIAPDLAPAHNNNGAIEKDLGNLEKAKKSFQTALELDPDFVEAAVNLTIILNISGQPSVAIQTALGALKKAPNYSPIHNALGLIYFDLYKNQAAKSAFERACSNDPNFADAHNNLGNTLTRLGQLTKANHHYNTALKLKPKNADFWSNKAASFQANNRIKEAIEACNIALDINPNHSDAQWNRGIAHLISGNLQNGFADYEARWSLPEFKHRSFNSQLWHNQNLTGMTILIYCEQGFGDTIHFIRYIFLLAKQNPKAIYLETHKPLVNLLKKIPKIDKVFVKGDSLPKSDYHIPLMSLAHRFKTTLENIPEPTPYLRTTKSSPYSFENSAHKTKTKKIGLVWAGRKSHQNDKNRSMPINLFLPFIKSPRVTCYSLQIGGADDCKKYSNYVIDLSSYLTDFESTGSIIKNLDLVITVDTALAHLAGSLGVKCWVMLPFAPDWRWLLNRRCSPWYSSITLFRQQKRGNWKDVVKQIMASVEEL